MIRAANLEMYKNKVKEMEESGDFEYKTCADVTYHYSLIGNKGSLECGDQNHSLSSRVLRDGVTIGSWL